MNLNPIIKKILADRGIKSDDAISEFISDKPKKTYDPFLLPNMGAGVDLILSAIEEEKKICIYGDYDADGVTSVTLLTDVLRHLTDEVSYYIPSRFDEGYGLNCDALDKIKESGADLVITVDCGSISYIEVKYAKRIGLDIIVTDHHTMGDIIPDCIVINPMHPENKYPFRYLAGVGVAFKLAQALVDVTGLPKSVITRNLDLVGIGTIGDVVPLIDENRTLAKFGLRAINITQRKGLVALMEKTNLKKGEIVSENISFNIVPCINASGRMADAAGAVKLLSTTDNNEAVEYSGKLLEYNMLRKEKQNDLFKECCEIVDEKYKGDKFIFLELEDAHEGITGIVAGKLKDNYNVPAIIATNIGDGFYKGTCRTLDGINIHQVLKKSEKLFTKFGGHKAACGFTIEKKRLGELRKNISDELDRLMAEDPESFDVTGRADAVIDAENVNDELISQIDLLEPFGSCNSRPLFQIEVKPQYVERMGKEGQYLRFRGRMSDERTIKCICFNHCDEIENKLNHTTKIAKVTGTLENKEWNGTRSLEMNVSEVEKQG